MFNSHYMTGTVTIAEGETAFTTAGATLESRGIRQGDTIIRNGRSLVIDTITGENEGTLVEPAPADTAGTGPLIIALQVDASRQVAASLQLIGLLTGGNIASFAELDGTTGNKLPMFLGQGVLGLIDRMELVSGVNFDAQVPNLTGRAAYDNEAAGFSVLVVNVGGSGRAAIYVKNTATSADWSNPAYITGPIPTIAAGTVATLAPGSPATLTVNPVTGGVELDLGIPAGAKGDKGDKGIPGPVGAFKPDAIVADLAGRAAYDGEAQNFTVLVELDSTNDDLPTLYYKVSATSGHWSGGVTFVGAGSALASDIFTDEGSTFGGDDVETVLEDHEARVVDLEAGEIATPGTTQIGSPVFFTGTDGKSLGPGNVLTPATITADQNNYNPTGLASASIVRLSANAVQRITGIGLSGDGRELTLANVGTHVLVLVDESTSSTSGFRFNLGGINFALLPGTSVTIFRDATSGRWRIKSPGVNVLGGFKNKIINPLGLVNQRGYTSGAAVGAANTYTLDRWRVVVSGQNLSWTTSAGVRTMTAPAGGVEQVIEGSCILSGTHVLNWEGTATATVNGTARAKGEPFQLTGGANVTIRFIGGTFAKPQLEEGAVPTPFEVRHPQQELALCQRYFFTAPTLMLPLIGYRYMAFARTGSDMGSFFFPVPMQAAPTLVFPTLTFQGCENLTIGGLHPAGFNMRVDVTGAGAYRTFNVSDNFTADAEL